MEIMIHVPKLAWLDSVEPAMMLRQLPILFMGLATYVLGTVATYKIAVNRFDQVDL